MNTIELDLETRQVNVVIDMPTIDIGVPGLPGPPGPAGVGYRHTQSAPSASWTVTHSLNRHPAVTIVLDTIGWVMSAIDYLDDNHLTITFPVPVTGVADM